jgi:hypothetical protein
LRLPYVCSSRRTRGWRTGHGDDGRCPKHQHQPDALVSRPKEADREEQGCNGERDPSGPAESRQQPSDKDEIGFGDEWQPGSCRLPPDPTLR